MKIDQLLNEVENTQIVLPEFQREYVWSLENAKQLFVSLFRNYPTGSLLFWQATKEELPEIKNNATPEIISGLTNVILDGQQRITTLYLIMKGEIPPYYTESDLKNDPRHLYFNLRNGEFQYYMSSKMETNPLWQKVTNCFSSGTVHPFEIASRYLEEHPEENKEALTETIYTNLTRLQNIRTTNYPVQIVPSDAKIDEAIDVFDRVNSLGTKLTDAELVLTHITGKWPHARRTLKEKIQQLNTENFAFDLDFLTRCLVVALTGSPLYKDNTKLDYATYTRDDYLQAWKGVDRSLDYLIPVLKQDAYISGTPDMSTTTVLIPPVAYLLKNGIRFSEQMKFGFLYWMNLALIWSRYSGQTESRLDKDVHLATSGDTAISSLVTEIEDQRGRLEIKPSDLEGRVAGHPLYRALYMVTKHAGAIDWSDGGPIYGRIGDNFSIQSHHIFPQALLYANGYNSENHLDKKKVNEIANRAFITRDTNFRISDKNPAEYLLGVEAAYPGALERQFIPMKKELWDIQNYEMFLEERRKNIAEEINVYLNGLKTRYLSVCSESEIQREDWREIIEKGENNFVEFKESLRWSVRSPNGDRKKSEYIALRAISSFLNSEGGTLFIGVKDDGRIAGIEKDYRTLNKANKDGYLLHLDNLIDTYLGTIYQHYIMAKIEVVNGTEICIIEVSKSDEPVYLKSKNQNGQNKEEFFIRANDSSRSLGIKETNEYISLHWK